MSHNYSYRRSQPDSNHRPDPEPHSSSRRRHASPDHHSYTASQDSFSSSSSSRATKWSHDGAFSILNSCGLEPTDLALLAELPEDALTVESLPQVLKQIKGKRGTVRPYPLSSAAPSSSSSWDQPRSQLVQYPIGQVKPSPLIPELDRWGNPITLSCSKQRLPPPPPLPPLPPPPLLSSSSHMGDLHLRPGPPEFGNPSPVSSQDYCHKSRTPEFSKPGRDSRSVSSQDYHHRSGPPEFGESARDPAPVSTTDFYSRHGPPDFGKTSRNVGAVSSQDRPSFSSAGRDQTSRPSQTVYTSAPLPQDPKPSWGRSRPETSTSSTTSSTRTTSASLPSRQKALDFHGATPPSYPHSCSLCAITVMSEKVTESPPHGNS
ncbi:ankyrin repeat domain-containing protein 12-like isoform X2 [Xyrichtys novacula]|uniref:Ankyrin repeat domain-containing protein 12-like isoform X2 n=1 Tax=Xyrichtys novacula TaxID=13765 RepID=A0AAV1FEB3_XYRNO|nr:ankyrin repeat domain-containing protein 12-like isoform X2 [Xyrichtys novacula]